ncbi:2-hydroxyhepta-2,4-diene-1,7-dioate isomerase [Rhodococcus sp. 06-621-2]|nr:fumarylacetoacetate hydrolase family protein [Rhodococcus sp. 06-621-2]OZC62877.1 2-hydroxyhepta-2,4-diene-1,7-dioate isomerase [Rhodococcus sp. 06-621-2]
MRWASFQTDRGARTGIVLENVIHALPPGKTLLDLIRTQSLPTDLNTVLSASTETFALDEVQLTAPIPRPPSMRDCLCYFDHMRNCLRARGVSPELPEVWYEIPAFYFAAPASVVGPNNDVAIAPGSTRFDFELEIAAVIGRPGRDLTPAEAHAAIAGYTIYCDWSARDLQAVDRAIGIGQAKGKDSATTLGPFLVTPDELPEHSVNSPFDVAVEARVNGRLIGSGRTGAMDWTYGEIISYASRGVTLEPGDVIASGTVPTCTLIEHFDANHPEAPQFPGWLTPGDVVELTVDTIGATRQLIVEGAAPHPIPARPQRT